MRDPRLKKLQKPIEIDLPEGWRARVTAVDPCLLQAAEELARGADRTELRRGLCIASFASPSGTRRRTRMDLLAHDVAECSGECGVKRVLIGILEELLLRQRGRAQPKEPERARASDWPYAGACSRL